MRTCVCACVHVCMCACVRVCMRVLLPLDAATDPVLARMHPSVLEVKTCTRVVPALVRKHVFKRVMCMCFARVCVCVCVGVCVRFVYQAV